MHDKFIYNDNDDVVVLLMMMMIMMKSNDTDNNRCNEDVVLSANGTPISNHVSIVMSELHRFLF